MRPNGCDVAAGRVTKESERSIRCVVGPAAIAQKRPRASGCVFISSVGKERPSANRCVKARGAVAAKRKKTNSCIVTTTGQAKKGVLPFRRVASGIAAIRWWTDPENIRGEERKTSERESGE